MATLKDILATKGRQVWSVPQGSTVVDAAVTGRVDFNDIDAARPVACQVAARPALPAGNSARTLFAVEGSGEDPSRGGLAATAGA
jgi:hypothetical protein